MGYLFWGFLFSTFDYILHLGSLNVGIFPDVLGYMFLVAGCKAMFSKSQQFEKAYRFCAIALFVSAVKYVVDLFGVLLLTPDAVRVLADIVYAVMKMFVAFSVIKAYGEMESLTHIDLRSKKLFSSAVILAAFCVLKAIGPVGGIIGGYVYIIAFFGALLMPAVFMVQEYDAYMNYKGNVLMK